MIKALTDHLAAQFNAQTNAFESLDFKNQKAILLIDYLFSEESLADITGGDVRMQRWNQ